jgi:CPA2 family monovalent cation:H+ antiporter-2
VERSLLEDVALVFLVASVATIIFQRLRQPTVLGYLLAGLVVGPNVPIPLFANLERIEQLSEIGVILVIFSIGLEFRFARLRAVLPTSGVAALVQIPAMLWLGYTIGQLAGWSDRESLFLGGMVCISSTMIVARVLSPGSDLRVSEHAFGILIVQDIAAIVLIAVFTAVAGGASVPTVEVLRLVGELALFLSLAAVVGVLVVPWLIRESDHRGNSEVLLLTAIGICCGLALVAEHLGFSVALGAFIAGSVIAESGRRKRVEHLVEPVRDLFAGVFFVSIGMLVDPAAIAENWIMIAVVATAVLVGMITFISVGSVASGRSVGVSVRTAMAMAQIGEFSFIIVGVGVSARAVPDRILAVAVGVAVVTTFLTPLLVLLSGRVAGGVERRLPRSLQTFIALYGGWLESLRRRPRGASPIRRHVILLALDAVAIAAVIVTVGVARGRLAALVAPTLGERPADLAVVAASLVVALPFVVSFARNMRLLGAKLALDVLPVTDEGLDLAFAPRRALIVGLELLFSLLAIAPLMALSAPFLPAWAVVVAVAVVLAGLGVLFWRRAKNLFGHVQASANVVLEWLGSQRQSDDDGPPEPAPDLQRILPGLGPLESITVAAASAAAGRTLAELDLRARTGATVLALKRADGSGVATPAGHDRLAAGDVLTISGVDAALADARELLGGEG